MSHRHSFPSLLLLSLVGLIFYIAVTRSDLRGPLDEHDDVNSSPTTDPSISAEVLHGQVDYVFDGDTLSLRQTAGTVRVRLVGIDAPERGQPYADDARDYLRRRCVQQPVDVVVLGRDRFDRILGDVYRDEAWLNGELVAAGYAWNWSRGHRADELEAFQRSARGQGRGLWADASPLPPWEFRRGRREVERSQRLPGPVSTR